MWPLSQEAAQGVPTTGFREGPDVNSERKSLWLMAGSDSKENPLELVVSPPQQGWASACC